MNDDVDAALAHIKRIMETPYEDLSELAELVEDESEDEPDHDYDSVG